MLLALWKVAPALITGNTMVIKPSPFTPLTSLRFGQIAQSVLPPGVLSVVSGNDELGPHMTAHPDIAKISFTGSTATGKHVIRSAAGTMKRVTLELGGNDAAIVMPDADWEAIIPQLFWGAVGNSGQWCVGIKRLYVHSSYHARFVDAFVAYARRQKLGDGLDPEVTVGPVQNRMQFEKIKTFLDDIRAKGYKVVLGGEVDPDRPGYFIPVTVVDNPPEDSMIVQEEQFAPIVPTLPMTMSTTSSNAPTTARSAWAVPCGAATPAPPLPSPTASRPAWCGSTKSIPRAWTSRSAATSSRAWAPSTAARAGNCSPIRKPFSSTNRIHK
ncbi:acyl-CoA reductase-like NAD-dependent aldehyde dehydrogenase [Massilia umbonata]|uniref:Acyl-CoA reductase-like NAD-dependent aldehyde dehydrogenase n=1 Tax=Pseudoduganella umbonata TaxID=864828 RepID=A0A7W5HCI5_9BURK|nr:acyl-CoA reductase-like NAD-dependent aldehyde dehydrogenase [Pseudoduganella umbonata]